MNKAYLFLVSFLLALPTLAQAQTVVTCSNLQGRTVIISQNGPSFSAVVYVRAGVGPALNFPALTLSQPHILGAPTIFSNQNFSLMVLSNQSSAWGTINIPQLKISNEQIECD